MTTSRIVHRNIQREIFAIRPFDSTTDDHVSECANRWNDTHRAPVAGALQCRLEVIRNILRFCMADIGIDACLFRPVVLRHTSIKFHNADIEQHRFVDGRSCDDQLSLLCDNEFLHSTSSAQQAKDG